MCESMRVFPAAFTSAPPSKEQLTEWLDALPVVEVQPRKPHVGDPQEWDDCADCTELRRAAEDVNREAQMTTEERVAAYWASVPAAFRPEGKG